MILIEKIGQHQIALQWLVRTVFFESSELEAYLKSLVQTGSEKAQPA
jgi:hypothetical protein